MPFVKGFGAIEIFLILLIIVIIFGVGRLPEVGAGLGKGIREFRRAFTGKESDSDETGENKVS